jgi:hypothetical protein
VENDGHGGGRWIEVSPDRLARWLESFAERHGGATAEAGPEMVTFRAGDGAVAACHVPFPPLAGIAVESDAGPDAGSPAAGGVAAGGGVRGAAAGDVGSAAAGEVASAAAGGVRGAAAGAEYGERIAAHACADRSVGVFLVRLGGYAAGVFTGPVPTLAASKVGSRLVHGRSAAGGTSQHRFARRREKQAAEALNAAADTAVAVFEPYAGRLDAVVLGGDRRAMAQLRDDPRLAPYFGLAVERFLTVPDPRLTVLRGTPRLFRAIRIRLTGPA